MCGIIGTLNLTRQAPIEDRSLYRMLQMIRHRGPDQAGLYYDETAGLGSARLSIIDLDTGQQPIGNEDGSQWIVFNGEIYNYVELRPDLEARGHRFSTHTDTEVILHLYEEYGPECLRLLNGQFVFAIWDARQQRLFLARDRVGVRPLFYTVADGALIFASEIKAILADARVHAELDPVALDQIFTCWSTLSPRTVFKDIVDVPPGHYLVAQNGTLTLTRYWQLSFPPQAESSGGAVPAFKADRDYVAALRELLIDAVRIRLRADVKVGAYLSGGLDSSTVSAIMRSIIGDHLNTFSISFSDPDFDESAHQQRMTQVLGTDHHNTYVTQADIGRAFPEVIWHTETPILRTSPVPMFLLSRLVRDAQMKVVLTGEGADEFLGGYDIFKEAKIRRFWARNPESTIRPLLFQRIYADIADLSGVGAGYLTAFFGQGLTEVDHPAYSHMLRWHNTSRTKRFFTDDLRQAIREADGPGEVDGLVESIAFPPDFMRWDPLHRAQYLESTIFLSQYLLSSQGDRMGMAHSVEGRFPFLDHRIIEFAAHLPPDLKLRGLNEKYILKQVAAQWLPPSIGQRRKKPFRAPIHRCFFNDTPLDYVRELLSPEALHKTGLFKPNAVAQLIRKIEHSPRISETDDMALVGMLSCQLVHQQFVEGFAAPEVSHVPDTVKVCRGSARC